MRAPINHVVVLLSFLLFSFHIKMTSSSSSNLSTTPQPTRKHQCLDDQRSALLQLQENLEFRFSFSNVKFGERRDCCFWDGVACDDVGHVTKIDLTYYLPITIIEANLEILLRNLSFLEELNLDSSFIYGSGGTNWCEAISHALPNLRILSFSNSGLSGPICSSLSNLPYLSELYLDGNHDLSLPPNLLANSSNLATLDLSFCNLIGSFPSYIFQFPKLHYIDLSGNSRLSGQLPEFLLNSSIQHLSLADTLFQGKLPWSISNLKSLRYLDLSKCRFSGVIPSSLANLTHLVKLDLTRNSFTGSVPPFQRDGVPNLEQVSLEMNMLDGVLYSSIFSVPSLQYLNLRSNQINCEIKDQFPNASASLLVKLDLRENKFRGSVPRSFFELPKLQSLYLGNNNFSDSLKLGDFQDQRNLSELDLSGVSLVYDNRSIASVQLQTLKLSSCNFTEFPNFLKSQNNLQYLFLSNNRIQGYVPNWIWKRTLQRLDLSHNPVDFPISTIVHDDTTSSSPMLSHLLMSSCGITRFPEFIKNKRELVFLDLSDNKLWGQIPNWIWKLKLSYLNLSENSLGFFEQISTFPPLSTLDLHANQLYGSIPKAMCNFSQLGFLDMSYNKLGGHIPDCLGNISSLRLLDLQRNNLKSMPSFAGASDLKSLKINGNKVEGKLPRSLANCSMLQVLDLGNNMIRDTFPFWLGELPALKILILRANKFFGRIGSLGVLKIFPMLHVMDLSSNELTGDLSKEFVQSLAAMQLISNNDSQPRYVGAGDHAFINGYYYRESMTIMYKGLEVKMERILTLFTCLDLSQNKFHGKIPEEISYLKSLKVLNLSHNSFSGQISSSMRNLTEVESLDLSNNRLSGEIPPQLTSLTFLAVMNLSYNQLEGSIPQANQFGTFSNMSYEGNPRLCGLPLTRKCNPHDQPAAPLVEDEESWTDYMLDWKIVAMGYGSGIVIGFSIGYTIFSQMRIKWFTNLERRARKYGRRLRRG